MPKETDDRVEAVREMWPNDDFTPLLDADHRDATAEMSHAHASTTVYELGESLRTAAQHLAAAATALPTAHTKISPLYRDEDQETP